MIATLLQSQLTRRKPPSSWDIRPFLLFFRISDDEPGQRRRREREFAAQHYPHLATLQLRGSDLTPGTYRIAPGGRPGAPGSPDAREVNLRPWTLDAGGRLHGELTALGQAELSRWLQSGLSELELTPLPEGESA